MEYLYLTDLLLMIFLTSLPFILVYYEYLPLQIRFQYREHTALRTVRNSFSIDFIKYPSHQALKHGKIQVIS
jgi:hypothetical protein